jgi:hypothetical protein
MQTISLVVHLTDGTLLTVRQRCQSSVKCFMGTGKRLKPLRRRVIARDALHFNNVAHYCYGRTKCDLCDLFNYYESSVFNFMLNRLSVVMCLC